MRSYKYNKETMDAALEKLQSLDLVERKQALRFISMASRSELFGKNCNTQEVRAWFISPANRNILLDSLRKEVDVKLVWEYLLTIYMVCFRYIDNHFADDSVEEQESREFKRYAYETARCFATHKDARVRQMAATIIGYFGDNEVWDIFCDVLACKVDRYALSHIAIGIRQYGRKAESESPHDFGGSMTENQRKCLIERLNYVFVQSTNASVKRLCSESIARLENLEKSV